MMDVRIRRARQGDAARLHELHTKSVREICARHYGPDVIDGWLANRGPDGYLVPIARGDLFVAADCETHVVGFGEATPGVIVACYVDPAFVGRGVGSAIMAHALERAGSGHHGSIRVEATLNAVAFYARFAFREIKRGTLRRGAVDVPYVLMERP